MIVLDENLDEERVRLPFAARYKGKVISIRDLRPGSIIKDEAIPSLLCDYRDSTFVTTNVSDFWRRIPLAIALILPPVGVMSVRIRSASP